MRGILRYVSSEASLSFEIADMELYADRCLEGVSSIVIDTLQIEVGLPRYDALYVWGYYPQSSWQISNLPEPVSTPGLIKLTGCMLEPGISDSVPNGNLWRTEYDPNKGWVRIAPESGATDDLTEIADGVLLGEDHGVLSSVWLQPVIE